MVDTVYSRVGRSLRTGRFPLLYGADCAVLLAAIPALSSPPTMRIGTSSRSRGRTSALHADCLRGSGIST
jgi:hypothetical protein